jgi:hypothetical protein
VDRPDSVVLGRDPEILNGMLRFYAPSGAAVLDVTANRRKMWDGVTWTGPVTFSDIDPAMDPDVVADFTKLPFSSESFDVLVFDPPHLPAAAASEASLEQYVDDYGLAESAAGDNVSAMYPPFLAEARRVLRADGLVFAKIKDFVHNHRYQWSLVDFVTAVRATEGMTPCDLRIKRDPTAAWSPTSGQGSLF